MDMIKLEATVRTEAGKASARRLRRAGQVPAVAYGKELASVSLAIAPRGLSDILKSERGQNSVVELGIDGSKKITALLRDYTIHPVTREVLHADFIEIKLDKPVDVEVPFVCKGKAAGVVLGGILRQVYRRLPVRCLPEKIPTVIEYDVTALNLGDHVKASDLAPPEGVTVRLPPDQTVAGVVAPEKERPEEVEGAVAGAAAPGAAVPAGGSTAPAAGGSAAPPTPAAAGGGKEEKKAGGKEKKK
jgi:large subunit ribosomal protein L25